MKTAGAKRRRTRTSVARSEGGKESRATERGVDLWESSWASYYNIPLLPPTSCHQGGGDARAISEGGTVFESLAG